MRPSRKAGAAFGAIGLIASAMCFIVFRAFTPIMFVSLLLGLPAAGYAWLAGWRRLAQVGALAAMAPTAIVSIEAQSWPLGLVAVLFAIATGAVVWFAARRLPWRTARSTRAR